MRTVTALSGVVEQASAWPLMEGRGSAEKGSRKAGLLSRGGACLQQEAINKVGFGVLLG